MPNNPVVIALLFLFSFTSCNAFKHGLTEDRAMNSYMIVTGDKDNFGDRRIKYMKGFHNNSDLDKFLNCNCKGLPDFIYEYKNNKRRGVKLYYSKLDSVFVFEEPKKGNLNSRLVESRKIAENEREVYVKFRIK